MFKALTLKKIAIMTKIFKKKINLIQRTKVSLFVVECEKVCVKHPVCFQGNHSIDAFLQYCIIVHCKPNSRHKNSVMGAWQLPFCSLYAKLLLCLSITHYMSNTIYTYKICKYCIITLKYILRHMKTY